VTAPNTLCPACLAGLLRLDPATGESGCGNCGVRQNVAGAALHGEESPLPAVAGGQAREPEDVVEDGDGIVRLVILACLGFAVLAVGAWAAGGGR